MAVYTGFETTDEDVINAAKAYFDIDLSFDEAEDWLSRIDTKMVAGFVTKNGKDFFSQEDAAQRDIARQLAELGIGTPVAKM